jgi:CheY-like chemotaxis protein
MTTDSGTPRPTRTHLRSFHELMQHRVVRIMLVSSLYDSFIMSEEGHLQETLLGHFIDLNLSQIPDLVQASSGAAALDRLAEDDRFDLIVCSVHAGDVNAAELARQAHAAGHDIPIIALAYTNRELHEFVTRNDTSELERIFLWQGDVRIFMAMVMYLEDRLNVEHDTGVEGVPAILVVEDNIRFYSSFLPSIYTEIFKHTANLLSGGLNASQRMMRMRARPKVLLCETYEEAWGYFEAYQAEILGIVSDVEYPRNGKLDPHAGLDLCSKVREARPGIRLVLQSSKAENRELAEKIGASFLLKGSPVLLTQLREALVNRFGFGDFVFRDLERNEIDRAHDLKSLAEKIATIPDDSLVYHAEHKHFSNWLKARTEFALAERLRPKKVSDFGSPQELREHLLKKINDFRLERNRTVITNFNRARFEPTVTISRIGGGSLGGKARGVAFANRILRAAKVDERFPDVDVYVPPSVVLGTETFDEFMEYEGLREFAIGPYSDRIITERFMEAPFPRRAISDLRGFLERVRYPIAVRSSSLLEDSLSQPFAGVYRTFMLPNNELEVEMRWAHLSTAIRRVYASVFMEQAKTYLSMTSYRLEEEKMAVMIQQLSGNKHEDRFYPDFAGVARSYNFYPEPGHAAEDGVCAVALGMGQTVVGGDRCLRFSPKHPRQLVTFSSVTDALENSQRDFWALDLGRRARETGQARLLRQPLEVAEEDGLLKWLGSTYCHEDNRIVDGTSRAGARLVSFAQILKHDAFPLAELLRILLDECSQGTGAPIEIEFAGNMARGDRKAQLAFLQMRPMAMSGEKEQVEIGDPAPDEIICRSSKVLGNGKVDDIRDIVLVDIESFERRKSSEVALQVARFDALLRKDGRPYVLIGVGRWGSSDPNLGIPVGWNDIAGARVIVEAGFKDFRVEPSQGTHFFQNLTSCQTGYFTVNPDAGQGQLDWDWLSKLDDVERTEYVRLIRLEKPLLVKMSGRTSDGVILKPKF